MACEEEQQRINDLSDELDLLREECAAKTPSAHGACGRIATVRTQLLKARIAFTICQQGMAREPAPPPTHADPCAGLRDKVIEIQGEIIDAQEDCGNGIHGQCGRIAGLRRSLGVAQTALNNCLHSHP